MVNYKHPFGKADEVKRTEDDNDTPQQKKFEAATGKDSDNALGEITPKKVETTKKNSADSVDKDGVPKGVDKDAWAEAERAAIGKNGGFSGVGEDEKRRQIQEMYNKQGEAVETTNKWEGKEDGKEGK